MQKIALLRDSLRESCRKNNEESMKESEVGSVESEYPHHCRRCRRARVWLHCGTNPTITSSSSSSSRVRSPTPDRVPRRMSGVWLVHRRLVVRVPELGRVSVRRVWLAGAAPGPAVMVKVVVVFARRHRMQVPARELGAADAATSLRCFRPCRRSSSVNAHARSRVAGCDRQSRRVAL
jgi:hypothetical protein